MRTSVKNYKPFHIPPQTIHLYDYGLYSLCFLGGGGADRKEKEGSWGNNSSFIFIIIVIITDLFFYRLNFVVRDN